MEIRKYYKPKRETFFFLGKEAWLTFNTIPHPPQGTKEFEDFVYYLRTNTLILKNSDSVALEYLGVETCEDTNLHVFLYQGNKLYQLEEAIEWMPMEEVNL